MRLLLIKAFVGICLVVVSTMSHAQKIVMLTEKQGVSLRGLSAVDDKIVWVSGSKGTVGKSLDGGNTWSWTIVKNFETRDFRDIEAFDDKTAVIMAVADPAYILRTVDGGVTWSVVYENKTKGMFLDAMAFYGDVQGTVVGDPIDGKFFIAHTEDGGKTWRDELLKHRPAADSADGCFASSGTNIRKIEPADFVFVAAGRHSRFYYKNEFFTIPFNISKGSTGANSLAFRKTGTPQVDRWITVGGDFSQDTLRAKNCFITLDHGKTWSPPIKGPNGYRSCVEFVSDNEVITCGLNGVDFSTDSGVHWNSISSTGFHVCRKAKKGNAFFLAGGGGRIGKLDNNR